MVYARGKWFMRIKGQGFNPWSRIRVRLTYHQTYVTRYNHRHSHCRWGFAVAH